MAEAAIPVDLLNPGQVFACLGFLEAAEVLLGGAEGGFEWEEGASTARFLLRAKGDANPFEAVLEFAANAEISPVSPAGIEGPWPNESASAKEFPAPLVELRTSNKKGYTSSALPVRLSRNGKAMSVSNWLEGDGRSALKLFAGNQVGAQLMANMQKSDRTHIGLDSVLEAQSQHGAPFEVTGPVGGRFGFDANAAWDTIRVGFSLNRDDIQSFASPLTEFLAVVGLENARPRFQDSYHIRYAVWRGILPPLLARAALDPSSSVIPSAYRRVFRGHLGEDKYYKKCFPATEEPVA